MAVQEEMVACIAFPIISNAIGNSVKYIESKKDYKVKPIIWGCPIAKTGKKKTPILNRLTDIVYELQGQHYNKFIQQVSATQQTGTNAATSPAKLTSIYTTNATIEGLLELLNKNKRGVILLKDELAGFILEFDRYHSTKGGDKEQYLNLWNGKPIKIDNVSKQLMIDNPFIPIIGGIQPSKAVRIFNNESFEDGLAPRFLFLVCDDHYRENGDYTWNINYSNLWNTLITDLYLNDIDSISLKLSDNARQLFYQYYNSLERRRPYVPDMFGVFLPKGPEYMLRFAGLLHVVEYTLSKLPIPPVISKDTLQRAADLVMFFLGQARLVVELYGPKKSELTKDKEMLIKSILHVVDIRKDSTLPFFEIKETFNKLVPAEGQIHDDSTFGKFINKNLKEMIGSYDHRRTTVAVNGTSVLKSCYIFSQDHLDKLKKLIA
jgi:hypothetical protein